jgi:hypothetical protein
MTLPAPDGPRQRDADSLREQKAISHFLRAVDEYVLVYRLVDPLEPDAMCLPEGGYTVNARAGVRRAPKEGDIFRPDVAPAFRNRIAAALRRYEFVPPNVATTMDTEELVAPWIAAGEPLPWGAGKGAFSWLFVTLPVLPEELEYRLVARHLALVDVRANIVVDVVRDVLPPLS